MMCIIILLLPPKSVFCSRGYDTASIGGESDVDTKDIIDVVVPEDMEAEGTSSIMRNPMQVDYQGEPYGMMKIQFVRDIQKYAKDLDITVGWEAQIQKDRRQLFKRVYIGMEFGLPRLTIVILVLQLNGTL